MGASRRMGTCCFTTLISASTASRTRSSISCRIIRSFRSSSRRSSGPTTGITRRVRSRISSSAEPQRSERLDSRALCSRRWSALKNEEKLLADRSALAAVCEVYQAQRPHRTQVEIDGPSPAGPAEPDGLFDDEGVEDDHASRLMRDPFDILEIGRLFMRMDMDRDMRRVEKINVEGGGLVNHLRYRAQPR